MRTRTLILVLTALLQLAVGFSRFLPQVSVLFGRDPAAALAAQVALHFTILSVGLSLLFLKENTDAQAARETLLSRIPPTTVRQLRDDEFYSRFSAEITTARSFVHICYFSPQAPDLDPDPIRQRYYTTLPTLIRRNGHVQFRRLVRRSAQNERWVSDQLSSLEGTPNLHIAILADGSDEQTMGLALSVQVIDEKHAWLVALGSHERESHFRDLYVENSEAALAFNRYFTRLWAAATEVMKNGQITPAGRDLIRKHGVRTS